MKKLLNPKTIIIFTIITIIAIIVSLMIRPPNLPKVIKSNPQQNQGDVKYFDPVELTFDQPVDPSLISVSSEPQEDWSVTSSGENVVTLNHKQYYRLTTNYKVVVSYDSKPIYTLSFTTHKQQSDPRYVQEVVDEMKRDYPLAAKAPYETNNYVVAYSGVLTFTITPKQNILSKEEMITQVKNWVKQNGIDPESHKYIVVSPTLAP